MYVYLVQFHASPKFLSSNHLNLNLLCASIDVRRYEIELANVD
jgi:hypothetical protein